MNTIKSKVLYVSGFFAFILPLVLLPQNASATNSSVNKIVQIKLKTNQGPVGSKKSGQVNDPAVSQVRGSSIAQPTAVTSKVLSNSGLIAKKGDFKTYQDNMNHIFPMILNREIVHYIHYYQTAGRKFFTYALERSEMYIPMIKKIFGRLGLPNDLAYLAMVESGFSPTAYSYAGASGMWQFIPSTGRLFGLTINWWVDERRNPVESTYAAGKYLKDLFNRFGSWYLAAAAYNSGELTIERALSVYPGAGFWTISSHPYLLPVQTRRYVPKIIAAAIIAKDPANFGFNDIKYKKPIKFKQVRIPFSASLYDLAKCAGISEYRLRKMNPQCLRDATPPNDPNFLLNIPSNRYRAFMENLKYVHQYIPSGYYSYNYYIRRGDTLGSVAYRHGVPLWKLERLNGLAGSSILRIGERIVIPGSRASYNHYSSNYVIVRPGMSLWQVSRTYGLSLSRLRAINHIYGNDIHPGEKLFIKNAEQPQRLYYYRVKSGDSLYQIASRFHKNVRTIMAYNRIKNPNEIFPGELIKISR